MPITLAATAQVVAIRATKTQCFRGLLTCAGAGLACGVGTNGRVSASLRAGSSAFRASELLRSLACWSKTRGRSKLVSKLAREFHEPVGKSMSLLAASSLGKGSVNSLEVSVREPLRGVQNLEHP